MFYPAERKACGNAIEGYRSEPGHIDCTGCYQCIPCPKSVAIGYIFGDVYNQYLYHKDPKRLEGDYKAAMSPVLRGDPASSCDNCGECLAKCPQGINIPKELARIKAEFGN